MGHLANFKPGFYSCYFFVPKKYDGLRPILDLSTYEMCSKNLQREGSHKRCLKLTLGSTVQGHTVIWLLIQPGTMSLHQLPRDVGSFLCPKNLSTSLLPPGPLGQHDSGSLYKSEIRCEVTLIYRMARHLLLWAQCSLFTMRPIHVPGRLNKGENILTQYSSSRMETTSPSGSEDLVCLWEGRGGLLCLRR